MFVFDLVQWYVFHWSFCLHNTAEHHLIGSTSRCAVCCYSWLCPVVFDMSLNPHWWLKPALKLRLAHIHTNTHQEVTYCTNPHTRCFKRRDHIRVAWTDLHTRLHTDTCTQALPVFSLATLPLNESSWNPVVSTVVETWWGNALRMADVTVLQTRDQTYEWFKGKVNVLFFFLLLTVLNKECSKLMSVGFSTLSHINSKSENRYSV